MKTIAYIVLLLAALSGPSVLAVVCGFSAVAEGQTAMRPAVYVFTSETCGQCQHDKPDVSRIANSGYADVVVIDADERPDLFKYYSVSKLPEYIVFVNGQPILRTHDIDDVYRLAPK